MSRPRAGRPPADRPGLNVERILDAALRIVDREGLPALSMRRLGRELGADPMAVYHHVPGKPALLTALVRRVFAEMHGAVASAHEGAGWRDAVRTWASAYRDVAREHPNLVLAILSDVEAATEGALETSEALFQRLADAGFGPIETVRAVDLIVDYVNGFVLAEASRRQAGPDDRELLKARLTGDGATRSPAMAWALGELGDMDLDAEFDFGIATILAGLSTLMPRADRDPHALRSDPGDTQV
jgi:TetR/AcrR family transcriptional regulator, tetracycline repressor protein